MFWLRDLITTWQVKIVFLTFEQKSTAKGTGNNELKSLNSVQFKLFNELGDAILRHNRLLSKI